MTSLFASREPPPGRHPEAYRTSRAKVLDAYSSAVIQTAEILSNRQGEEFAVTSTVMKHIEWCFINGDEPVDAAESLCKHLAIRQTVVLFRRTP